MESERKVVACGGCYSVQNPRGQFVKVSEMEYHVLMSHNDITHSYCPPCQEEFGDSYREGD